MIRETKETWVEVAWSPAGTGRIEVETGVGFLDHLLSTWALFGGFDLALRAEGDLNVDAHHTAEDSAIALGESILQALGDRSGIVRFGWAYAPLEEALSRAVVDMARRPFFAFHSPPLPAQIGALPGEMVPHVFRSLAFSARFTLHVDVLRGEGGHHLAESAAKALGLAMGMALAPANEGILSAKGVL
jgi:imidazoleglycerol phosphate dehydratase HisB